jgi:hypothetical protein
VSGAAVTVRRQTMTVSSAAVTVRRQTMTVSSAAVTVRRQTMTVSGAAVTVRRQTMTVNGAAVTVRRHAITTNPPSQHPQPATYAGRAPNFTGGFNSRSGAGSVAGKTETWPRKVQLFLGKLKHQPRKDKNCHGNSFCHCEN